MFGLRCLRTNSFCCCCGISLRTGTFAIIIVKLIGGLSTVLDYGVVEDYGWLYWIGYVIYVIIEIAALYGTFKRKPNFLIPHLVIFTIYLLVNLVTIIGLLILLPFATKVLGDDFTYEGLDGETRHIDKSDMGPFYLDYGVLIVLLIISEAITFHFYQVVLSYYYELKTKSLNVNPDPPTIGSSA